MFAKTINNTKKGNSIIGIIITICIIWGIASLFSDNKTESNNYSNIYEVAPTRTYNNYTNSYDSYEEPENPYSEGTGHSAGYEWAEENDVDSCGGKSQSFIEGCEEYLEQRDEEESYEEY